MKERRGIYELRQYTQIKKNIALLRKWNKLLFTQHWQFYADCVLYVSVSLSLCIEIKMLLSLANHEGKGDISLQVITRPRYV
jgi:hypothetical protein